MGMTWRGGHSPNTHTHTHTQTNTRTHMLVWSVNEQLQQYNLHTGTLADRIAHLGCWRWTQDQVAGIGEPGEVAALPAMARVSPQAQRLPLDGKVMAPLTYH